MRHAVLSATAAVLMLASCDATGNRRPHQAPSSDNPGKATAKDTTSATSDGAVSSSPAEADEDWQGELHALLRALAKATSDASADEAARLFVPGRSDEIHALFEKMKGASGGSPTVDYQPLSFARVGDVCYVTVKQTMAMADTTGDSQKRSMEYTMVFAFQNDKEWRILDNLKSKSPFVLDGLWARCTALDESYRARQLPWTVQDLNLAEQECDPIRKQVRDAVLESPDSAMFAGSIEKWTTLDTQETDLFVLANVSREKISGDVGEPWLRAASVSRIRAVETLALLARPVARVVRIDQSSTYTTIVLDLHPVVFGASAADVEAAGFSVSDDTNESGDRLFHHLRASDFTLMDVSGNKTKASDLGTGEMYADRKPMWFMKTKQGGAAVEELFPRAKDSLKVVVRFPTPDGQSKAYKIVIGDFKAFGILLIRPKDR